MQATIGDRNRIHGNIAGHLDKSGEGLDDVWINRMDESLRHKANTTLRGTTATARLRIVRFSRR
jgi:hypothetical protein